MEKCPICKWGTNGITQHAKASKAWIDCPRCGRFALDETWVHDAGEGGINAVHTERQKAVLGYAIRKGNPQKIWTKASIGKTLEEDYLPGVAEQVENFIFYLGCKQHSAGDRIEVLYLKVLFLIGATEPPDVMFLIKGLIEEKILVGNLGSQSASVMLTIRGWERFAQLTKGVDASNQGFMAMPFGFPDLTNIYYDHWKPATEQTGLPLVRLDENPMAGSISNRMRVEIRRSRYLVAELTHNNAGAYWEAGFAEGLGKPVIYLCEKSFFVDPRNGIHFDVSQRQAVVWEAGKLYEAEEQLKDIIRNTFPQDARLSDRANGE